MGVEIGAGTSGQYPNTVGIDASELLPGDLGFMADGNGWGHVLMFAGYDSSGSRMWVHCTSGSGVVLNTPSYESSLSLRRLTLVDYEAPVSQQAWGEPLYEIEVTVTHYCACAKCCGKSVWDPEYGITASGTTVEQGRTVAVDPEVIPIGSILYIDSHRYVAEDVGGAVIGNHVDIYFDSHADALEFGVQEAEVWLWTES